MQENERDNIIMLEDENGEQIEFEVIDVYTNGGNTYFAMVETNTPDDAEEDEVLIMRVEGEGDDMELVMIEDEEELERAFDEFLCREDEIPEE